MTEDPARRVRNTTSPDSTSEKQSELKLNVGIGTIGTILSFAVAVIFFFILDEIVLGVVFVVVALVSLAITLYAAGRKRRAASPDPS
ncbi:hypothetical protein Acsp06_21100 [Actinomycetospora sp. NBRC 106375]|uniref:hypothetical protein n=1 Tax=Actinomycetospora sp. NBRC 106375 TaxID=3032207 RepID=UPI00249FBDAD|nr:hypothetical protein [Actinomycetospora sp. NBRC 106375]GLZ45925.1 hypothetical protein Acsp06_21100 [Actinomycetospora sp. NBRC 106375]